MEETFSTTSSSPSSYNKIQDLGFTIRQKKVIRILVLFLGLIASCLILYKAAYPLQRVNVNNFSSLFNFESSVSKISNGSSSSETKNSATSFKQVLEKASTKNNTVIVTTLNQAWAEPNSLFDLFLESFRIGQGTQKLLKHVVVVCLDPKSFLRCSQLHPNCYQLDNTGTDFSGEKVFMSPDYLKMMWRRIKLLIEVLQMGFNFIFTDADIMWLRDPFQRLYPDGDFQMACDRFFGDPYNSDNWVNGGLVYAKSNNRTIQFYKFWYKSRLKYPGLHDQDVFNKIKHDSIVSEIGIQMRFFDTIYFGGFCETSKDINLVCTMHANCCIGLENKLHDLNLVLDDWRKYLSLLSVTEDVQNTTWSAPNKCLD